MARASNDIIRFNGLSERTASIILEMAIETGSSPPPSKVHVERAGITKLPNG